MTTWSQRDLPVLRWLHENPPEHGMLATNGSSEEVHPDLPELSEQDVQVSVETLAEAGLVDYAGKTPQAGGAVYWTQFQVTGAGLQALGEWPAFEVLGSPDGLAGVLVALADRAASDEEERYLRRAASITRSKSAEVLQSLFAGALSGLIRAHVGL